MSADDTNHNSEFIGYNEWAQQQLHVKIATDFVYEYEGNPAKQERGVFIAEDVGPHTEVFSIPLDSMFTVRSVHTRANDQDGDDTVLRDLAFFQQSTADTEDEQLAIALLYEKFVRKEQSKWHHHIELLPSSYHNVLYFRDDALKHLRGSNLYFIAKQMEHKVAADYAKLHEDVLTPLFEALLGRVESEYTLAALEACFSLAQFKWALSTIWSRFVSLRVARSEGSQSGSESDATTLSDVAASSESETFFGMHRVKAMVPVFDMLNHDPDAEMSHFFDVQTQTFKLVSHQHWSAGSQMFINYGALSNHKLLALYGFVIPKNPFDALDVWVPMDESSSTHFQAKAQVLADNGLDHATTPFELTADELNELLLIAVRIEEIECESVDQLKDLAAKALDGEVLSFDNEHATLTRLIYTLQKMLDEFDGTLEEDDAILRALEMEQEEEDDKHATAKAEESDREAHKRMAVIVRRSDKCILTETIDMLKWKLLEILPTP